MNGTKTLKHRDRFFEPESVRRLRIFQTLAIKTCGTVQVLHETNISIDEGEFLVLVGPSGCGKSTLLNMIAGLEEVTSGDIAIKGRSMNGVRPADRNIAMVFQSYALYPNMNVAQNMAFGLEMHGVAKAERDNAVAEVKTANGSTAKLRFPTANEIAAYDGREVILGIRPEAITDKDGADRNSKFIQHIENVVEVTEPAGSDTFVVSHLGDKEITGRFRADVAVKPGEIFPFAVNMEKAVAFDPETEMRIG